MKLLSYMNLLWSISSMSFFYLFFLTNRYGDNMHNIDIHNDKTILYEAMCFIILFIIIFSLLLFIIMKQKNTETIKIINIKSVELKYVSIYLALFVIALGIDSYCVMLITYVIICVFLIKTKYFYFHPLLLFCGWNFYEIELECGKTIVCISKIRIYKDSKLQNLKRLNDYVYMIKKEA